MTTAQDVAARRSSAAALAAIDWTGGANRPPPPPPLSVDEGALMPRAAEVALLKRQMGG